MRVLRKMNSAAMAVLECCRLAKFALRSVTYNSFTNRSAVIDAAIEPVLWMVEKISRYLGPVFNYTRNSETITKSSSVFDTEKTNKGPTHTTTPSITTEPKIMVVMVIILSSLALTVIYVFAAPFVINEQGWLPFVFHVILGHWLFINTIFNYYKGVTTSPGSPPAVLSDTSVATICKKCIAPKPPRTHHCSLCNRCVLKMDHHCPWLNNCVGHLNHRYFISFCVYMTLGTAYISIAIWPLFAREFFDAKKTFRSILQGSVLFYFLKFNVDETKVEDIVGPPHTHTDSWTDYDSVQHKAVSFLFFLSFSVVIALGLLTAWHVMLISQGETSIERNINSKERSRLKKVNVVYKNPYDFGWKQNWRNLLGLNKRRKFWSHILLPSSHPPLGDGIAWERVSTPGYVTNNGVHTSTKTTRLYRMECDP